jgi:hypothetical protein
MQVIRVSYGLKGFARLYNDALKWSRMLTEKAKHKIKVLVFWEKHGLEATLDAFPHKLLDSSTELMHHSRGFH